MKEKVAYRLLEPELITGKDIIVVGGGDSAIESALLLADANNVTISYRNEVFNRIKPANSIALNKAITDKKLNIKLNTNLILIDDDSVTLSGVPGGERHQFKNDLVYIFAGGELPTQFLEKAGIKITKKFGETVLKR
jgi:thioredoxin reductase